MPQAATKQEETSIANAEKSIDVSVPTTTAYNQWTQFETSPQFMEGVKSVKQLDDRNFQWEAEVGGKDETWSAEITEQIPDKRIAWRSTGGAPNAGVVTFHHLSDNESRVMLQPDYEPDGIVEKTGDMLGMVERRIEGDLERFKESSRLAVPKPVLGAVRSTSRRTL